MDFQYPPRVELYHRYDSDPRGYFNSPQHKITYRLNNLGLRGADIHPKEEGVFRVLAIGDSFTFGDGVHLRHIWTRRLQEKLRRGLGEKIEVVNMALGGWSTRDELYFFRHYRDLLRPDAVVLLYILNDAEYAGGMEFYAGYKAAYEKRILRSSYVISYLQSLYLRKKVGQDYLRSLSADTRRHEQKWEESFSYLSEIKKLSPLLQVYICPFLFNLSAEYPLRETHDYISSHLRARGIETHDLLPRLLGHPYERLWVHPSDPHPNEVGHQLLADAIYEHLAGAIRERQGRRPSGRTAPGSPP